MNRPYARATLNLQRLRQAKVQDFDFAFRSHLDVGGFQVAVNDAFAMGGIEPLGNLAGNAQRVGTRTDFRVSNFEFRLFQKLGKRLAGDELENQDSISLPLFEPVYARDVRVAERGEHLSLALESRQPLRIGGKHLGQDFESDFASESRIPRAVNFAHPACPGGREHLVGPDAQPWRKFHGRLRIVAPARRGE